MARIRTIKPKFGMIQNRSYKQGCKASVHGVMEFSDDIGVVIGDTIWLKSKYFRMTKSKCNSLKMDERACDKWIYMSAFL